MSVDLKVYSWDGNAKKTATKTFKGIDANAKTVAPAQAANAPPPRRLAERRWDASRCISS